MAVRKERIQVQVEIGSDKAKAELNALEQEAAGIRDRMRDLKKGTKEYKAEAENLKQVQAQIKATKDQLGLKALSMKELQVESRRLRREINQLTPGTAEFIKKAKELQQVQNRMKEVRQGITGTAKATNGLQKSFRAAMAALGPLLALGSLFEGARQLTQYVLGLEGAWTKLEGTIARASGLQGEALNQVTGQVQALANTFELETSEINRTANAMAKNMGISYTDALVLIEQGMLAGANMSGDFLDQLYEYAPQFKAAGIEAETMVAQLVRAEREGIFSDKGADAIKEFGLRIREQTKATGDALRAAFGNEFTDSLFKGINDGSISSVEALKRVSAQMNNTAVPANKLQTVIADVFGGAGEDAGIEYLKSLKDIDGGLEDLIDTSNGLTKAQQSQLALEKELAAVQGELASELEGTGSLWKSITTTLQIFGTQVLLQVVSGFNSLKAGIIDTYNNSIAFRGVLQGIGLVFKQLMAGAKAFAGFTLDVFSGLGNVVKAVLKGEFSSIPDVLAEAGRNMAATDASWARETAENVAHAYNETLSGRIETPRPDESKLEEAKRAAAEQGKLEAEARNRAAAQANAEAAEKLRQQREELRKKELEAERAYQDLQLELMEEGTEKEIAQIRQKYERQIAAIDEKEHLATERIKALRQLRDQEIAEIEQETEEQRRQEDFERWMQNLELDEEQKKLVLEEKFQNALITEQQRDQQRHELERAAQMARIELLKQHYGEEHGLVLQANAQLLALDKQRQDEQVANEQRTADLKRQVQQATLGAATDFLRAGIQLLGEDEKARKKNAAIIKAFSIGEILIKLQQEVAGYMAHPANTATFGTAGALKSAAAVVRAGLAISQVQQQQFARGGIFDGPLHSQGGMPLLNPATGQVVAELEGGEPILSRQTYINNKPIIDRLLDASMNRGGAPIMAEGGMAPGQQPAPGLANGEATASTGRDQLIEQNQLLRSILHEMVALNKRFPHKIEAYLVHQKFRDFEDRLNEDDADSAI